MYLASGVVLCPVLLREPPTLIPPTLLLSIPLCFPSADGRHLAPFPGPGFLLPSPGPVAEGSVYQIPACPHC